MSLPKITFNTDIAQFIYAVAVIIIVPAVLAFNTLFLLRGMQRDIDFELNNKALLVESVIAIQSRDKINNAARLNADLNELVTKLPEIRAIEVFRINEETLSPVVTTSQNTKNVTDPVLNQLAWGSDEAYSKQIFAALNNGASERVWLVASPVHDQNGKKIALLNIYLSAAQIDSISERTTRDSLFIMMGSMMAILLLLLNHFRFFEISILFKRLSEVDKLKDDFISMASHELRTPLTAIAGYAYLLMRNPVVTADEKVKHQISIILASTERLKNLVEDILDVSRIEQKRLVLNMGPNDLGGIINGVINELLPQAQAKNLKLVYDKPNYPLIINCDKNKMHEVFVNLIGNSIKYTPQGQVTILHVVKNSSLKTYVKDTGIGISQEDMGKLFNKFSRIQNDKTRNIFGTGLGLWITKQLVERMGGKITVGSIEGQGTQFEVAFSLSYPNLRTQITTQR